MTNFFQFLILGLGAGAVYTLLAQGVVLIYRGSGLVNFAQGAIAMVGGYVWYVTLVTNMGWSFWPAFVVAVLAAALVGLIFQQVVLRLLTKAAPITRVISTLGLLIIVQGLIVQKYGPSPVTVGSYLPQNIFHVGKIVVQDDRLILFGIGCVLTAVLWALMKFTRFGLAITASAENERATATLGWSPNVLGAVTWTVGSALAGAAGILVAPITNLDPINFVLVVTIAGLAAALVGGFKSFPLTLLGGVILGCGESLMTLYGQNLGNVLHVKSFVGAQTLVSLAVIIVVLVVRGRGLPLRSHVIERLPTLGSGRTRWLELVAAIAVALVLITVIFNDSWVTALAVSLATGVIILSVVILTGYTGQLSLAQYAIGGLGALFAAKSVFLFHVNDVLAIIIGIALAVPISLIFAIPALRTRGVNLAVVTLSLGYTVESIIFNNSNLTGKGLTEGTQIGHVSLFGIRVDSLTYPNRWAIVCLIAFVLTALLTANLRRSASGRRLLAVRTNERAAASLGVSVFRAKLYAFGIAGAIASFGGILLAFRYNLVVYSGYDVFSSIYVVAYAVIGGIGYVIGAVFGSTMVTGGLGTNIFNLLHLGAWTTTIGGVILLVLVIVQPNGAALPSSENWARLRSLIVKPKETPITLPDVPAERVHPSTLKVDGITVRFGGVVAVDSASLEVEPGQIVGLIGPNGAGKTTFIDAVTGFVRPASGSIVLDEQDLTAWSAAKRSSNGIRRSFQSLELFDDLTVVENIMAGTAEVGRWSWLTDLIWPISKPLTPSAVAAVREFDLEDKLHMLPTDLSYGQRRLVAIARSVASGPSILLLDEPAAGLDQTESRELAELIRRLADERGMGVLLVEHDVGMVMSVCDRVVVIDFGKVIADGTPAEVREDPNVIAAYLGEQQQEEVEVAGE